MEKTGLLVGVLRPANHRSLRAQLSDRHDNFVLVDHESPGPFTPNAQTPELNLVRRDLGGPLPYIHAVPAPATWPRNCRQPMFGGNFIHTSDSRFPNEYPIPIHDRFE